MKDGKLAQAHKKIWYKPEVSIMSNIQVQGGGGNNQYNEGQFYGPNHSHVQTGGGPVSHVSGFFPNYVS